MNEQTEKNVNEAIDWLQQVGGSVQDFAIEQAPLYCREVVAWQLWSGVTFAVVSLLLIWPLWLFVKWMRRIAQDDDCNPLPAVGIIAALVIGALLTWNSVENAERSIKAAVSPRLVIVEHLRGLK